MEIASKIQKRNYSIDTIKFFCIVAVIVMHVRPFNGTKLDLIINPAMRFAVPVFFICSGYFFYNKYSKEYTIKYVVNLIKVFITWIIIYILYDILNIIVSNWANSTQITTEITNYFQGFKIRDLYYSLGIIRYHLWYLSTIIIVIPVLHIILCKNILNKAIFLGFILNIIGIMMCLFISGDSWFITRDAIFYGFFYCCLGAIINKYEDEFLKKIKKLTKFQCIAIIAFFTITTILERHIYIKLFKGVGDYFISTISLSIFIFLVCLKNPNILKNSFINKIGQNTLGIYVSHILIMDIITSIEKLLNNKWIITTEWYQVISIPMILILSYVFYGFISYVKKACKSYFNEKMLLED